MSQLFASGGQSIGASASASVLPMHIQDWFPLGLTGLISLPSKGFSRVFSNTTVWKLQFGKKQIQPRERVFFIAGLVRAFSLLLCIVNIKKFNCQNPEATRMTCNRWMNKQTVIYPDNGMLFHDEKKWAVKPWKTWRNLKRHITKWKKPIWTGNLCDCNYMIFWRRQNYRDNKRVMVARGLEREKDE